MYKRQFYAVHTLHVLPINTSLNKMHFVKHHLWHTPTHTCFGTEVPFSGRHYNKGV